MSAFIVSNEVINRILSGIESGRFNDSLSIGITRPSSYHCKNLLYEDINELGKKLYKLNVEAVMTRYPDTDINNLPGSYVNDQLETYQYKPIFPAPTLVQLYKDVSCLLYQCSEGDITKRELYKELTYYRDEIARDYINRSPGYDDLPWG